MASVTFRACERPGGCECDEDGNGPMPGCLWFYCGKRDDGGLGDVLAEALAKQAEGR